MSPERENFVAACLKGEAVADEIDDFVDRWHDGDATIPLHEFLGFTWDEYALWVERPNSLKFILDAREQNSPLGDLPSVSEAYSMAARSMPPEDVEALIDWLRRTGRVSG